MHAFPMKSLVAAAALALISGGAFAATAGDATSSPGGRVAVPPPSHPAYVEKRVYTEPIPPTVQERANDRAAPAQDENADCGHVSIGAPGTTIGSVVTTPGMQNKMAQAPGKAGCANFAKPLPQRGENGEPGQAG